MNKFFGRKTYCWEDTYCIQIRLLVNPHTPVAQKIADEVAFRRFQGEGVDFF